MTPGYRRYLKAYNRAIKAINRPASPRHGLTACGISAGLMLAAIINVLVWLLG